MKKENEEMIIEEILKERINENKKLFDKAEIEIINNNISFIKKIYLLGIVNGRDVYR